MSLEIIISISIISSFLTGWLYVIAATTHPLKIFKATLLYSFILFISISNLVYSIYSGWWILILAFNLTFFVFGYLVKSRLFLIRKEKVNLGQMLPENIKSKNHTAIIYFTHGEPETYDPIAWIDQFREFDEQKIKFVPFFARTFFINSLRKKYLIAGKSNHRDEHYRMMKEVEKLINADGDNSTHFYMAFLDDKPGVAEAVIKAVNEGASRLIISTVFLTVSSHTACGKDIINQFEFEKKYGVKVEFTDPLWDSDYLQQAFLSKVNENLGEINKDNVAVALIGYGQPLEWDKTFPTQTEQEIIFREKIIERFINDGYKSKNLGMAWMDFKKPTIKDLLDSFSYETIKKVFYFAAAISADSLMSQVLIPERIEKYPFPIHVVPVNLGAWDVHPLVIKAIKNKIDKVLVKYSKVDC